MKTYRFFGISFLSASVLLISVACPPSIAQPAAGIPAGQTALTFVNRLLINPPEVLVYGYFPSIEGLPGPLFAGVPGESTAYFTWSLNAAGAQVLQNGDTSVAVLNTDQNLNILNIYFNANPSQTWNNPASFSGGQLIATFKAQPGTQTGSGPVAMVTQSYVFVSSTNFSFKGQTFNFSRLLPHGFTLFAFGSNLPLANAVPPPPAMVFTAAGSGIAIGGPLSAVSAH